VFWCASLPEPKPTVNGLAQWMAHFLELSHGTLKLARDGPGGLNAMTTSRHKDRTMSVGSYFHVPLEVMLEYWD
jgi:hypothetical protein